MKGLNKVLLIGNVGNEPELKELEGGMRVVKFDIATTEQYKSSGQGKIVTEWHTIIAWDALAEVVAKYVQKGSKVYIEGKLKNRTFEDKVGNKKKVTEIIATELIMLDKKEG